MKDDEKALLQIALEWVRNEPISQPSKENLADRIAWRMISAGRRYLDEERQYRKERERGALKSR